MQANPVLAEVRRGNWVENRHRGAFCVAGADGVVAAAAGDVAHPVFPRSAIKAMQALAMFRSGAVGAFGLDDEALALACASHIGEPGHIAGVTRFLERVGCSADDLECGAHPPTDAAARRALRQAGEPPSALHNNCSGKHAGMLAVAKALGAPTAGYVERDHPVQLMVRDCVAEVIGTDLTPDRCGTDGCSIPTWAAPLKDFATGFARMAGGTGLPGDLVDPAARILDAATAHPFLIRGTDSLDTDLMAAFEGRLMLKIGAEGVFCGAVRDRGLGFALKIDDGNMKAAEVTVTALLMAIAQPNEGERAALEAKAVQALTNWRGREVGAVSATDAARPGCSG